MPAAERANRLVLDASLHDREPLRYTPAGIPALSLTLRHASEQPEAEGRRKVECEIAAVAYGSLAESLSRLPADAGLRARGFLARRYRTGITLCLHITEYELTH